MPENNHKKERILSEVVSEASSSDEKIVKRLKTIIAELEGTTGQIIEVDQQDILGIKLATGTAPSPEKPHGEVSRLPYDGYPLPEPILTSKITSLSDFARWHTALARIRMLANSEKKKAA